MTSLVQIAVVGGSIGGLTAACLLRDAGHDVTVFERSSRELEERGAGIGFLGATGRFLAERGGVPADGISIATSFIRHLGADGSIAHEAEHRYRFSSWNTVYRRTLGCFDPDRYLLGHELVDFSQDGSSTTAQFGNGAEVSADLLVAADGIGSTVRRRLIPGAISRYAGYVAWRGTVPQRDLAADIGKLLGDAITYFVYPNSHILVYPIPDTAGSLAPEDRLMNFVWYRNYAEGAELDDLLTDAEGVQRALSVPPGSAAAHHVAEVRATAEAKLPGPIAEVVLATEQPFVQSIHDIEVDRMAFDRVCLLGDAAFAVRPHAAAGTAKAADDGWRLAEVLQDAASVPRDLLAWESTQLALGRDLLARTRKIGRGSQVDNNWEPGNPELIFGLRRPGD